MDSERKIRNEKLVRDRIPEIIRTSGQEAAVRAASNTEYSALLRAKLQEEVDEFLRSDNDPDEIADILEILHALARDAGISWDDVERIRATKAEERGGFTERWILGVDGSYS
jgi:predicted house-cleaning noncanonical NTP pyrophosphatase (MazG superfamily)